MELTPTELKRDSGNLHILWSDASQQTIPIRELRRQCPCAHCRDSRSAETGVQDSGLPILDPQQARPLDIVKMEPAGNYAYTIQFSDGHTNGIFTFEFLRSFLRH